MRLRQLWPLVVITTFLFVLILMMGTNLFTLNYLHFHQWSSIVDYYDHHDDTGNQTLHLSSFSPLITRCMHVSSFESSHDLITSCFNHSKPKSIEKIVHFIHLPLEAIPLFPGETHISSPSFTLVQYASFQSIRKYLAPHMMILHYPTTPPHSFWYTQCQRHLSLHRIQLPPSPSISSLSIQQRYDIIKLLLMLRALRKQGGIAFHDFYTMVLQPYQVWSLPFVASCQSSETLSTHMIQAQAGDLRILFLESTLETMFLTDDQRLQTTSLSRLLWELVMEYTLKTRTPMLDGILTSPHVLSAIPLNHQSDFLQAPVDHSTLHSEKLKDAIMFHLHQETNLVMREHEVVDLEAMSLDKTLFGAILRYVTSHNTSAELDHLWNKSS